MINLNGKHKCSAHENVLYLDLKANIQPDGGTTAKVTSYQNY